MQYAELHLHDHYSSLDGVPSPDEYAKRAAELGMTHLAQTNHGTNAGHREHQRACKEHGITPILGQEMYFSPTSRFDRRAVSKRTDDTVNYNHLSVLAANENGLKNLNRLSDIAWTEGYYHKPRMDFDALTECADDLVVLSGCMSGPIAKALGMGKPQLAEQWAAEFKDLFGERFFVEIMSHNSPELNAGLLAIAKKFDLVPVITSDCHHARKEDLWVQEAMLILSTNPKPIKPSDFDFSVSQKMDFMERFNYLYPERTMTFQEFGLHLNSVQEHLAGIEAQKIDPAVISNTMRVAEMIGDYPYYEALDLLPRPAEDANTELKNLVRDGLRKRGLADKPEYQERVEEELEVITSKNFSPYFIIAADACGWAKEHNIRMSPGRGSDGGSLVCYALGITEVDPIRFKTEFFRFLDPSRDDWPDADLDFQDTRRHEVIDYVRQKYVHVANIATFAYFKDKGVIKDCARVFKVPLSEVNKALKTVDSFEAFASSPTTLEFRQKYPEVQALAEKFRGHIRSLGMHAGGIVIGNKPLNQFVPTQTATNTEDKAGQRIPYVAVDMNEAANIGLIKYDFLGLKALTVVQDSLDLIKQRHNKDIDLYELDLAEKPVYDELSLGHTAAIFQCEQSPYTKLLVSMEGVNSFEELVASNALVRPGATNSSFGAAFIQAKNGGSYSYIHPDTEWFTKATYGAILYQEQTMRLCTELAGMTMGEANKVRRAIGKKKADELAKWEETFVLGASKKIGKASANALWKDLSASADYSFNRSHAVAYSMLSYHMAWLKLHYPLEFMTAVLRNEKNKDSLLEYLIEAKRLGLRVLLPHVNVSGINFEIQEDEKGSHIRFGLASIKFISAKTAAPLMRNRPFADYAQLSELASTKFSGVSSRTLGSLNAIGAAEFLDNPKQGNERDNYFEYLNIPAFATQNLPPRIKAQLTPLDEYDDRTAFVCSGMVRKIVTGPGWSRLDLVDETGTASVFADEHTLIEQGTMYVFLVAGNSIVRYIGVNDIIEGRGGRFQEFLETVRFPELPESKVRVVAFKTRKTKAGKSMATAVFTNQDRQLESVLVFPDMFLKAFPRCTDGATVQVEVGQTNDGTLFLRSIV